MLRVRWLGRVAYRDAHALQQGLFQHSADDHLLLLEHPHVYTLGVRAQPSNILVDPATVGADVIDTDRGGDVTYHGPGQLVGYPILTVPDLRRGGLADTAAYVHSVEQLLIDTLADLGFHDVGRLRRYPGVWFEPESEAPRKVAAIGVRLSRGRSMHGFALNVDPDMSMYDHIVPCGITELGVTSLAAEGYTGDMRHVVDTLIDRAVARWGAAGHERADVVWRERPSDLTPFSRGHRSPGQPAGGGQPSRGGQPHGSAANGGSHDEGSRPLSADKTRADNHSDSNGPVPDETPVRLVGRLAQAGVTDRVSIHDRKPEWMRVQVRTSPDYLRLKATMRDLQLVTVCEEAGCPNIYECWGEGTATFMINGERCTRACGFCLVDTRHPAPPDPAEPEHVAEAVERMELDYVVLTTVARDDLADGGAGQFADTIAAIRRVRPSALIEVLISDLKGNPDSLQIIFDAGPDIINHNVETVPRLQRVARPSASYACSLAVLARAKAAGFPTKSGLVLGMGETFDEVVATLADLRGVGVDIVTAGQYLRPTVDHLPVARWWTPDEFDALIVEGERLGIAHVEASPLTRSSHHAQTAAAAVGLTARVVEPA